MILIENTMLNGKGIDILIHENKIVRIGSDLQSETTGDMQVINGQGTAVLSSLFNGHTHSPMVLLRGFGDDLPLHQWLTDCIWPVEGQMTEEDYLMGYRLAFLEMIKSGTGFFNEMYMFPRLALKVLEEIPMKGLVNYPIIDGLDWESGKKQSEDCELFFKETIPPEGVQLGIAAHSIYANSESSLCWIRDFTSENNLKIHIHLSETEKEVEDCKAAHGGMSPVEYLHSLDFLSDRVLAAHCVWLSNSDMEILARMAVTVIHNPVSNMKLATGRAFPYAQLKERGVPILLGTDGAASNNNLDLFEEMKVAALLQKHQSGDPTVMTAGEIFHIASKGAADIFGTGGGDIREGAAADLILVDLDRPEMVPLTNITSNLVYSTSGNCVRTLISGGRILMENRMFEGEDEIRNKASVCAARLVGETL